MTLYQHEMAAERFGTAALVCMLAQLLALAIPVGLWAAGAVRPGGAEWLHLALRAAAAAAAVVLFALEKRRGMRIEDNDRPLPAGVQPLA